MKTRKQTEITAVAIYRVNDKVTGKCLGYLVPSDTEGVAPYEVTYNYTKHCYQCNCPATVECKHLRAVKEVCEIRNHAATTPLVAVMEQAHAAMVQFDRDGDPNAYEVLGVDTAQRMAAYAEAQNSGLAGSYKASWYR